MSPATAWLEAAFLGLIQGLTEFLPVSSSAHLRIIGPLLPWAATLARSFTASRRSAPSWRVLLYFRHDIARIFLAWWASLTQPARRQDPDARMGWLIIIGSVPIVVLGLLFKDAIEGSLRNLYITATMLIVFAVILGLADRLGRRERTLDQLTWRHGVLFGLAQAMALIPGVSRSGGTITAGLLMGYTREAAARYSFLLAIPAVMGSGFYQLLRSWQHGSPVAAGPTALATLIAFGVGYGVIVLFLKLVSTRGYCAFVSTTDLALACWSWVAGPGVLSAH